VSAVAARRLEAMLALILGVASVVLAVISAFAHFPRGLIVLACLVIALAAAWHGVLRRGPMRVIGLAIAIVALAAAVILLLGRDPLLTVAIVAAAVAGLGAARAAFSGRVRLPSAPPPTRAVMFFNPRSGGGKAERFRLAEEAQRRGIEAVELTPDTTLESLVDRALAGGADGLAMAGGDGSQAVVAAAAARAGVPYACIPAGTRNHLALDLGVDRDDPVGALDAFVAGAERRVDLAEVNGRVFVNNVSLGLYAQAVQRSGYRNAKLRTLVDTIPDFAGSSGHVPAIRWSGPEGITHEGGIALLVSNNPYRLGHAIGSGTRPRMDGAQLGVAVIAPPGGIREGLLELWAEPSLEVDADAPIPAGIDGESALLEPPVGFAIRPAALRVRIAPGHPGCSPSAILPEHAWQVLGALARIAFSRPDAAARPPRD
jgi:Diacylglycerol kinase catalytic domain